MYILAIKGKESEGAYAPTVDSGQILYISVKRMDTPIVL